MNEELRGEETEGSADKLIFKRDGLSRHVKKNCVMCGGAIDKPTDNYVLRGNYCPPCNNSCGRIGVARNSFRQGRTDSSSFNSLVEFLKASPAKRGAKT